MIKAVLYDLGDIFFEAHLWRKWNYEKFVSTGNFSGSFADFYDLYEEFLDPVYTAKKEYMAAFSDFLDHLKISDKETVIKESLEKKKFFEDTRKLYDGVHNTLAAIKELGVYNIVITDNELSETEVRNKVIGRYGINQYLDRVVTSKNVGAQKPSPVIFQASIAPLGLSNKEVVFVGHDKDEIDGAAKAGITTILFNNYLDREIKADYQINSFAGIISVITSI